MWPCGFWMLVLLDAVSAASRNGPPLTRAEIAKIQAAERLRIEDERRSRRETRRLLESLDELGRELRAQQRELEQRILERERRERGEA